MWKQIANVNSEISRSISSSTVSFHNFKLQDFKLSVSNPKKEYVAYLSVLSQISNCRSLGRKNKHEILKADRSIAISIMSVIVMVLVISMMMIMIIISSIMTIIMDIMIIMMMMMMIIIIIIISGIIIVSCRG